MYRIRKYRHSNGRIPFDQWIKSIADRTTRARLLKRLDKVQLGNLGDWSAVGGGVYELREHFGPGFRIYYGIEEQTVVLLLCGGSKSSQAADIDKAKYYWQEYKHARD